jgi:hypothetical protein
MRVGTSDMSAEAEAALLAWCRMPSDYWLVQSVQVLVFLSVCLSSSLPW